MAKIVQNFWKSDKISGKLAKFSENWPKLAKIYGKIPEFCVKWGPPGSKMIPGFLHPKFSDLLAYTDYFTLKIRHFLGSFWPKFSRISRILSEFWPKFPKNVQKLAKISPFLCAFFHVSTRPLYSPSIGGPPGCKFGPPQKIPKISDLPSYVDLFTPKNRPFLAIFCQNLAKI